MTKPTYSPTQAVSRRQCVTTKILPLAGGPQAAPRYLGRGRKPRTPSLPPLQELESKLAAESDYTDALFDLMVRKEIGSVPEHLVEKLARPGYYEHTVAVVGFEFSYIGQLLERVSDRTDSEKAAVKAITTEFLRRLAIAKVRSAKRKSPNGYSGRSADYLSS